ncbi:MAG: PDDEXK nuclease domain-containing protein, partial [Patescibacteria group bacterium]
DNLKMFLLELGKGFSFVSRQHRISLGNNHFYVDLVFYHRILKCFVLVDIKIILCKLYQPVETGGKLKLFHGKGCPECNSTGYSGRVGIFEVLPISPIIAKMILERSSSADVEIKAIEEGMISMKQDGYMKVLEGVTTIEEVLRVAQD